MGRRGRFHLSGQANTFFITTAVMNFARVFSLGEHYYAILRDSLQFVLREHHANLLAYVFMPSHVHLVAQIPEGENISDFMRDFKKYTSTRIRQRLDVDGRTEWLEQLRQNAAGRKQVFKLWMDRFDDLVLFSERQVRIKIEYIHANPVRAGLIDEPEKWKYSSARNYFQDDHSFIHVDTEWW